MVYLWSGPDHPSSGVSMKPGPGPAHLTLRRADCSAPPHDELSTLHVLYCLAPPLRADYSAQLTLWRADCSAPPPRRAHELNSYAALLTAWWVYSDPSPFELSVGCFLYSPSRWLLCSESQRSAYSAQTPIKLLPTLLRHLMWCQLCSGQLAVNVLTAQLILGWSDGSTQPIKNYNMIALHCFQLTNKPYLYHVCEQFYVL